MDSSKVFFVGNEHEVRHHAQPLRSTLDIEIVDSKTVTSVANAGDIAIFTSEHFDPARIAIAELRKKRVATLYAIDGILEWRNAWENEPGEPACPWTMRPVLSDKVACIGLSQARVLNAWGNSGKTEIVGIPRFEPLRQAFENQAPSPSSQNSFRVLIMTAKWPGFTPEQRQLITQSLVDLKQWFESHPSIRGRSVELTWRLTGGLEKEVGVKNSLGETTGQELAEVLQDIDATITTPSTAQLESMLAGVPTAILDYTNSPAYVDAAWKITGASQIGAIVEEMHSPSEARMHFQRYILRDAMQLETNAVERMSNLVSAMLRISKEQINQPNPLQFPISILDPVDNQSEKLELSSIFPQHDEFGEQNVKVLQAELAHARREIDNLNHQMDGLREELGQAHQIFDQIHNHPVAGPVVRTRQKLIDWMSQFKKTESKLKSTNLEKPTTN